MQFYKQITQQVAFGGHALRGIIIKYQRKYISGKKQKEDHRLVRKNNATDNSRWLPTYQKIKEELEIVIYGRTRHVNLLHYRR